MNDNNSLAHTKWNCKYHIVCALPGFVDSKNEAAAKIYSAEKASMDTPFGTKARNSPL